MPQKPRPRNYRKRQQDSDEEEQESVAEGEAKKSGEDTVRKKLEETKELQKFRKKPSGVSAVGLAFGQKFSEDEKLAPDPFKLKTGGLVDMKDVTPSQMEVTEDEVLQRLASTFSAETNQRDDETHMLQYIEQEMSKRKGETEDKEEISSYEAKIKSLYKVPERFQVKEQERTEEMLSNQMLSGIPEVDLGLGAKFKNIEETELAKQRLMEEREKKKEKSSSKFTLHSLRFYKHKDHDTRGGGGGEAARKETDKTASQEPAYIPVVGENEPELKPTGPSKSGRKRLDPGQMATDDFHYDKYKKRSRHY